MVAGFGVWDLKVEELIEAGDRVFVVVRDHAVGRASGVPVRGGHIAVWTLSSGRVVRLQTFKLDDRHSALEAAGLLG
jgi:ketosteroid isomerase-like protein